MNQCPQGIEVIRLRANLAWCWMLAAVDRRLPLGPSGFHSSMEPFPRLRSRRTNAMIVFQVASTLFSQRLSPTLLNLSNHVFRDALQNAVRRHRYVRSLSRWDALRLRRMSGRAARSTSRQLKEWSLPLECRGASFSSEWWRLVLQSSQSVAVREEARQRLREVASPSHRNDGQASEGQKCSYNTIEAPCWR
jgi:hypothetical protein